MSTTTTTTGLNLSLPHTMAGLLETALRDAGSLDRDLYNPNYNEWHNPDAGNFCEICLAGCLIAGTLKFDPSSYLTPTYFPNGTARLLDAIDNMRNGQWCKSFELVYNFTPPPRILDYLQSLSQVPHSDFYNWDEFDSHLAALKRMLPQLQSVDRAAAEHIKSLRA